MILSYFLEYNRYMNVLGIATVFACAVLFSRNRSHITMRLVLKAFLLQLLLAAVMIHSVYGQNFGATLARGVTALNEAAEIGIKFIFGALADSAGPWGFIFAVKVLPITIFFGALTAILIYFGIIQRIAACISYGLTPFLGITSAESLCAVSNSFLGQTGGPLLIKNVLKFLTPSEMMLVMVSGMGTISASLLAVYAGMGVPIKYLLSSCIMAIPSSILIAKILSPENEHDVAAKVKNEKAESIVLAKGNLIDTICVGTIEGLHVALNVGAILIAFIALIAMANSILAFICVHLGLSQAISLQTILGWLFAPFGFLLGLEGAEVMRAGELIGTKIVANEMIAYTDMVNMGLSERAIALLTYALCGFSNVASIGIQVSFIGTLAPEKRHLVSQLGWHALLGGTLSNMLCAFVAGLFL